MEKVYTSNRKRMILYLLVFILTSGTVTYISIQDTMKYKKVLEKYDDSLKQGNLYFDSKDIIKNMQYNNDSERYSFRVFRTMIILGLELFILYAYFLKNSKIVIDEDGIKVYSLYRKQAEDMYTWDTIKYIKFQYADGIRGLIPHYGMSINNSFIPLQQLLNYNEISDILMKKNNNIHIEDLQHITKQTKSVTKLFKEAYIEYKSDFKSYMVYSFIIFIFAILTKFIETPFASIITPIANIYFGYRSKIAMNYKAYMSYNQEDIDFDMGWDYAKGKMGRYFGAEVIIGVISIVFLGIEYLLMIGAMPVKYKIVAVSILGIIYLFGISRLYLITYIASIVDVDESYMSLNAILIKKYYKEVLVIFTLLSMRLIPLIIIGFIYYKDLYIMKDLIKKATYISIFLDLFIVPYVSCFIMNILKKLTLSNGDEYNE